jgi:plastocyanin
MTTSNTTPKSASIKMGSIVAGSSVQTNGQFYKPGNGIRTVGSMLNWVNDDTAPHTITLGTVENNRPTPTGPFDSRLINSADSFPFVFDKADKYAYYCIIHPWMSGKIPVS